MKANNANSATNTATAAKATYEAKVITEALNRAGGCKNLHGHVHEILIRDSINANPASILKGESAKLVANPTAKAVDVVVMKGGKVLERIQAKDTAESIGKTVRQIADGKYNSAQLWCTKETTNGLARHADKLSGAKTIKSSGISSEYTKALAQRAGASGAGSVGNACLGAAKSGGAAGGVVSGGIAVFQGACDLIDGSKSIGEVAANVTKETAGGALSGAAASAAATATGAAVSAGLTAAGITGLTATVTVAAAPVAVAIGVGIIAKGLWDSIFD